MSQAASRPDLFGRSKDAPKRGFRQKLSSGVLSLFAALVVWGFGLWSAAMCIRYARDVWGGESREFMLASIGSLSFSAAGLHYEGQWGAILAGLQGGLVLLGLGMTLSPSAGMRRCGSFVVMAWSGLWLAGGVSLAMEVPSPTPYDLAIVGGTVIVFLCTMYRTSRIWSVRHKGGKGKRKG